MGFWQGPSPTLPVRSEKGRSPVRRTVVLAAVIVVGCLVLTACGNGGDGGNSGSATQPPKVIQITFSGTDITPNGTDIDVQVGQPIEFDVTADKPGEIHVHSSPKEQEFQYDMGSSTFHVAPIQAPGQVVVESHTLNKTLFTLVAR
jgi:hypothetical protein